MKRLLVASTMVAACKKEDGGTPVGGYAVVDPMPLSDRMAVLLFPQQFAASLIGIFG